MAQAVANRILSRATRRPMLLALVYALPTLVAGMGATLAFVVGRILGGDS